jgi:formamidopyrimidine-DNA glycosylase
MPELPEVELAAGQLRRWLGPIDAVDLRDARVLRDTAKTTFVRALCGREPEGVDRIGKHLFVRLSGQRLWWIHLGMAGRLVCTSEPDALPASTRWSVRSGSAHVAMVDPRVFSRTAAGAPARVRGLAKVEELGPDALTLGAGALGHALARTGRPVKVTLMDQKLLAGVGNIQAAEALFRAGIHPARPAATLDEAEVAALWRGLRGTLEDTLRDLRDEESDQGEVTYMSDGERDNPFDVYGREGEPCPRCGAAIERISQGGRSTFFCGACQPDRS